MSTAEESAPSPGPLPLRQALITVGIAAGVLVLGNLVLLVPVGGPGATAPLVLIGWGVLTWVLLVAGITAWRRRATPSSRAGLYVAAAAIGGIVDTAVQAAPDILRVGPEAMLWFLPTFVIGASGLVLAAVIGSFSAVGIIASAGRPVAARVLIATGIAAVVTGGLLILALAWQFFDVYFSLFGTPTEATEADGTRYLITAALAITLPVAAAVIGGVRRSRALLGWGIAAAITAVLLAFVLQVPAGRFWVDPGAGPPADDDYVPCFGEGDPNCVGG